MSMTIISNVTDILTYVCDSNPGGVYGYEGGRLITSLVEAIRASDHPAWGSDWEGWLDEHIDTIVQEVCDA